jgi:flavodoxin
MTTAVIYESSFGTTRKVAQRIAEALDAEYLLSVDDAPPDLRELDLLVVGGPTHVHGMTREGTRKSAADQGAEEPTKTGVREWVEHMPDAPGLRVAAFDTRVDKPMLLTGSAARGIGKALRRHGCELTVEPESFFVTGTPAALLDGELERAEVWAERLR